MLYGLLLDESNGHPGVRIFGRRRGREARPRTGVNTTPATAAYLQQEEESPKTIPSTSTPQRLFFTPSKPLSRTNPPITNPASLRHQYGRKGGGNDRRHRHLPGVHSAEPRGGRRRRNDNWSGSQACRRHRSRDGRRGFGIVDAGGVGVDAREAGEAPARVRGDVLTGSFNPVNGGGRSGKGAK